jgi:hypothetical protein
MKELRKKRYLRTQKMKPDDTGRTARYEVHSHIEAVVLTVLAETSALSIGVHCILKVPSASLTGIMTIFPPRRQRYVFLFYTRAHQYVPMQL